MEAKKGKALSGLLVVMLVSSLLVGINVFVQGEVALDAQAAELAIVGPDASKLFPQPEVLEEAHYVLKNVLLGTARPVKVVVTAYPREVPAYLEGVSDEPATVNVMAQLLDYFGQPVGSGYEVTFSSSAGTMPLAPIETNEMGIASATLIVDTPIAKEVLITATYVDRETLIVISANTTIRVTAPAGTLH